MGAEPQASTPVHLLLRTGSSGLAQSVPSRASCTGDQRTNELRNSPRLLWGKQGLSNFSLLLSNISEATSLQKPRHMPT